MLDLLRRTRRTTIARMDDARELLTVSDVAMLACVTRRTVYAWIARGKLRPAATYRRGAERVLLFDPAEVRAFVEGRQGDTVS